MISFTGDTGIDSLRNRGSVLVSRCCLLTTVLGLVRVLVQSGVEIIVHRVCDIKSVNLRFPFSPK